MGAFWNQDLSIRAAFGLCALITVSLFQSCIEIKDAIYGITGSATVVKCDQMAANRMNREGAWNLVVLVQRVGDRPLRIPLEAAPRFGPFKVGDQVEAIYRPNSLESARRAAERSIVWPAILGGLILTFAMWCVAAYRMAEAGRL